MAKKEEKKEEKKLTKKEEQELKNKEVLDDVQQTYKCKALEKTAVESRRKFDWEWMVRSLYVRGYHFARYNRGTNTIVFATRTGVRIPINLVNAHLRGVRNQVTSFQPKWEVLPNVTTESAFENARYSGKTLDYVYKSAQIKRKIKEAVNHALIYSIGIWHFDIDSKKNIVINNVDPFDFYVDPNIKGPDLNDPDYGAEYVILTRQVPIDYIKNNKDYSDNRFNVDKDNLTAAAEYKRFLLQVTKKRSDVSDEETPTTILKQAFIREKQEDGSFKIRNVVYVEGMEGSLKNELTDESEYPFEIYQGDISSGELYAESWIKHLIPINRVIDALESHIFEYNHFFAKGRFVVDKNSGVRVIVNQHGQIIEKNRGSEVQSLSISPLPPSPFQQLENMRRYFEDMSGVHDVSLGRLPGSVRSGVAIAELKQADATNQNDLIDNLEDFLSRAGRKVLKLIAENWNTTKLISVTGLGGKPEYFMAVGDRGRKTSKPGEKFQFGEMDLPIAVIGKDNEVRVQVGSWLAYTKEARQEKLKELFRLGAIDQKTYLEHSEFADIDGIMERTRGEALLQNRMGQPSLSAQRQFGPDIGLDDESIAIAENELMLEGTDQPVFPDDDHEVHLAIHKEEQDNEIVRAHINEHIKQMRWLSKMPNPSTAGMMGAEPGGAAGGNVMPEGPLPMGDEMGQGIAPEQPIGGMPEPTAPGGLSVPPELAGIM